MALGMNGLKYNTLGEDIPISHKKSQRRRSNPYETLSEVIQIIVESGYEDGAVSDEELEMAMNRFRRALEYVITRKVEEILDEKKQV